MKKGQKEVFLTERSIKDFLEIESYSIRQWGKSVANNYLKKINFPLTLISENPEILRSDGTFFGALCFYRVEKHFLIFSLGKRRIILLTIAHASRDMPARLEELLPYLKIELKQLEERLRLPN